MGDVLQATPAQVLAAKLLVELSEEAGVSPDEALKAIANAQEVASWTAYARGFGEHIGTTLYETARLAREDSGPGERIYRITHVETVTP